MTICLDQGQGTHAHAQNQTGMRLVRLFKTEASNSIVRLFKIEDI